MTVGEYQLFASRKSFETKMTTFGNRLHSRCLLSFPPKARTPELNQLTVAACSGRMSLWSMVTSDDLPAVNKKEFKITRGAELY
jgi:hypothetical protein